MLYNNSQLICIDISLSLIPKEYQVTIFNFVEKNEPLVRMMWFSTMEKVQFHPSYHISNPIYLWDVFICKICDKVEVEDNFSDFFL